jgi:hypothetical protein
MTLVLISLGVPAARAQHEHGDEKKGDEHGKPAVFTMPTTYKAAVAEIELRLHEISESIADKKLDKVHTGAHVIQKVAQMIGQLALKEGSGVPKEAVKDINLAGTDLAAKFDAIDKAVKSGDLAATKKVYAEMVATAATLQKYVSKVFQCPMKCEKERTYDKPGKCPKCGMDVEELKSHADHAAKHGGVFFMAPDQKHHLEGTLSATNEFRIYFYDEYTKPISADKFNAAAKAWNKGADESNRKPVNIALGSDGSFLTGQVDTSVKIPLSIKVFIDFKDGQKPQVFDFDFSEPSKEPSSENKDEHGKGHSGH